jgi:hypothetical protein
MSVKAIPVFTEQPFCEYNCPFMCDICVHNLKKMNDAIDNAYDEEDAANGTVWGNSHVPSYTAPEPKVIKVGQIIFVDPLSIKPLKLKEGEIITDEVRS